MRIEAKGNYMIQLSIWSYRTVHKLQNVMFKIFFWPYMVLHMLHFLWYPLEMSILTRIVHFRSVHYPFDLNFVICDKVFKFPFQSFKNDLSSFLIC